MAVFIHHLFITIFTFTVTKFKIIIEFFATIFAFFHFVFDTIDEFKATINQVHQLLKVIDTDGNNMVNRMINIENLKI